MAGSRPRTTKTLSPDPDGRASTRCARKVECVEEPAFTADYHDPEKRSIANSLRVELNDGTVLEETVEYPIGHRRRREEGLPLLVEKFKTNLRRRFAEEQQQRILDVSLDPDGSNQCRSTSMSICMLHEL